MCDADPQEKRRGRNVFGRIQTLQCGFPAAKPPAFEIWNCVGAVSRRLRGISPKLEISREEPQLIIPMIVLVKVVAEHVEQLQPVAELLRD